MALTKRSENQVVYLTAKHYCLWREFKKELPGCDVVDANNPATGLTVRKYGEKFHEVTGRATKLFTYNTGDKYAKRYIGFKLQLVDGPQTYVLDMPYQGQMLRRFLRLARNIDWNKSLSVSVFRGKKKPGSGAEDTGIWFQQEGATVKAYYTREAPHGMPEAYHDSVTDQWDFRTQHRWLVDKLIAETIPDIEAAAARVAPPIEPHEPMTAPDEPSDADEGPPSDYSGPVTDEDVPF
jgi:hypothetical protein